VSDYEPRATSSRFKFPNPERNPDLFKGYENLVGNDLVFKLSP